jgi:maleate isomerase
VVSQSPGFELKLIEQIETITAKPATTSIVAAMTCMCDLQIQRVGLVNPYPEELNSILINFLRQHGYEVAAVVSLGADFTRIGAISGADVYRAAKRALHEAGKLDGLYLPCPQFPVLDVIEQIESDLGVPAVSHIGSELYVALKSIGVHQPIHGYGRLLSGLEREH